MITSQNVSSKAQVKGYLCYKTILCRKVALDVQLMNFFIWKKKCFVLKILRFLCFCEIRRSQNLWRHHKQTLPDNGSCTYAYFFWILSTIKMKFDQILVCYMTNISNMLLTECWRLETSLRLFYDFIKITKIVRSGHF